MKKCKTKKLGITNTILGSFCSFFNWEGANFRPQIRPRKIPEKDNYIMPYCRVKELMVRIENKSYNDCEYHAFNQNAELTQG